MEKKAQLFVTHDTSTGDITLSAYSIDSEEWENNHITVVEMCNGRPNTHESVVNVIRNILFQAGIQATIE